MRINPEHKIRLALSFFIFALIVSGLTAIPLQWELNLLQQFFSGLGSPVASIFPGLINWLDLVSKGLTDTFREYPFIAYGTDWLAFGHISLAIVFIGPLRDPVKNFWVIEAGMLICILVIPWALIFGHIRGIPFFWTLIDMSFGVFGIIPLWIARKAVLEIATFEKQSTI